MSFIIWIVINCHSANSLAAIKLSLFFNDEQTKHANTNYPKKIAKSENQQYREHQLQRKKRYSQLIVNLYKKKISFRNEHHNIQDVFFFLRIVRYQQKCEIHKKNERIIICIIDVSIQLLIVMVCVPTYILYAI